VNWNDNAAAVQAAIEGLDTVVAFAVTGAAPSWTITFAANPVGDLPPLAFDDSGLTGCGDPPCVEVAEILVKGVSPLGGSSVLESSRGQPWVVDGGSQDDTASGVVSSEEPMAGSPSRTSERHVRRSRQPARAGPAACACQSTTCACRVDSLHVPVNSVSTACACRAGSLRMPACSLITSNNSTSPLCR
jgi:hypothetical protein